MGSALTLAGHAQDFLHEPIDGTSDQADCVEGLATSALSSRPV